MKTIVATVIVSLASLAPLRATISSSQADRLRESAQVLQSLQATPDRGIPQDIWNRAACVAVLPDVKKAAFIFGGEYGKGAISCKSAGTWSAPAFIQLEKGSWGFQIGAEEVDLVLMIMNRSGVDKLLTNKVSLGAGASVAAGPVGRSATASTDLQLSAQILSYSRSKGVFAGIDLSGGVLGPDNDANHDVYGAKVDAKQIVSDGTIKPPAPAEAFMAALKSDFAPAATTGQR